MRGEFTLMSKRKTLPKRLAFAAAILAAACHRGDQIAPEGATIDLAANPATIVLPTSGAEGEADIFATVRSAAGVPLPDQDVRFTTSAGSLFMGDPPTVPAANVPIRTDDLGNAEVHLVTSTNTTITARSGKAMQTLALNTVTGNLSSIILNLDTSGAGCLPDNTFTSCSDTLCLEAQALDTSGGGLNGVTIVFGLANNTNGAGESFIGTFTPSQVITAAGGFARTKFALGSNCQARCGGGESCQGDITASIPGGLFASTPQTFFTTIP